MKKEQKNFNVNVDADLSDAFSTQIDQRGFTKYRAIEGALRGFMSLPEHLQVRLIAASKVDDIKTILVEGLLESEIARHLDKLGPPKAKFLALLKQAKEPSSRKK